MNLLAEEAPHERGPRTPPARKKLRLPTFLSDYEKLAKQCAAENKDHVQYLLRLSELELIERERRCQRRSKCTPLAGVKMHHLMHSAQHGCPGSP